MAELSAEGDDGRVLLMRGLERYMAYEYRLRSVNELGSTVGGSSGPILTDTVSTNLGRPPQVAAYSSASFSVSWIGQTSHCRPQVLSSEPLAHDKPSVAAPAAS